MSDPIWLSEGATVAVKSGRRDSITIRRVIRLTQRDVVLDSGDRFNRARLSKAGPGAWDGSWTLHDPKDPAIVDGLTKQRARSIRSTARTEIEPLLTRWWRDGDDVAAAQALQVIGDALDRLAP